MRIYTDFNGIRQNVTKIKSILNPKVKFCAVVKANAYGHGMVNTAKSIQDKVDFFAVARFDEAVLLQKNGIVKPILIFNPDLSDEQIKTAAKNNFRLTLNCKKRLDILAEYGAKVHLKVDSGMGRLGESCIYGFEDILEQCKQKGVCVEGVYSHFASDVVKNPRLTFEQYRKFEVFIDNVKKYYPQCISHICNTAGAMFCPAFHCDMVRIGIGLYGYSSSKNTVFKQCKSVFAKVVQTKKVLCGQGIGYDHVYVAKKDVAVAVVDCGYGDGLPRRYSGYVVANDKKMPILGNICMDMMMIENIGNSLHVGDEVIVLGENGKNAVKADDIAKICDTITYEILCNLRER